MSYAIAKEREVVAEGFTDVVEAMIHKRTEGLRETQGYEIVRLVDGHQHMLSNHDYLELNRRAGEWR